MASPQPMPMSHPLPAALSRSAMLHDMSEDTVEHCTPVVVLSPARKESGRGAEKPRRRRRRRRALERYEHAEEHRKGRRSDFNVQSSSPKWRELYPEDSDSSCTDESRWIQAKRRAQVKFRVSRRRRRDHSKQGGNVDGSSTLNKAELVDVASRSQACQELIERESCSLNLQGGKVMRSQEYSPSLAAGPVEMDRSSPNPAKDKGRSLHGDLRLLPSLRRSARIKKRCPETDTRTEVLAVTDGGRCVGDRGLQVHSSLQQPSATCDDHLEVCRSVPVDDPLYLMFLRIFPPVNYVCVCVSATHKLSHVLMLCVWLWVYAEQRWL